MNDITALMATMKAAAEKATEFGEERLYVKAGNVLALVEALEKTQQRNGELETYSKTALEFREAARDENRHLKLELEIAYSHIDELREQLRTVELSNSVLESRTVTVKLPPRVDSSNVPFTAHTWNCCLDEVEKCLVAAGIQVIEGEGQ